MIFFFWNKTRGNNLAAEVILSNSGKYENARFCPVNSENKICFSPYIMENKAENKLLSEIERNSEKLFKTALLLNKHVLEIKNSYG